LSSLSPREKNNRIIIAMVAQVLTASAQSSHSLQSVESHIERLFQEINLLIEQKKEVENVKKYTVDIKQKISKIETEIQASKQAIDHCQTMLTFPPGSWVRNGTTKPGKVIELVIAGRIPEVHVQWHGASITVPESPAKLTLVKPELLEYVWNGDRYPKLIRIIDGWECDEIDVLEARLAESIENKEDPDRRFKLTYCKKRIEVIDQEDLVNLERAVRQGLQVFYRVGEALAEIRDRKLYKQHGFTDFRDYLREYWNMGKSRAYQLIESGEVMRNLNFVHNCGQNLLESKSVATAFGTESSDPKRVAHNGGQNNLPESVPNCGQNLPRSESITRELAKAPRLRQAEAWKKAVETAPDHNPTAAHTKAVVAEIIRSTDKDSTVQISSTDKILINDFAVGQLVQIKSDRTDKRLVGYNLSVGIVTQVNTATVSIKIWGQEFDHVSPSDLAILDEQKLPVICLAPSAEQYRILLARFESKEQILEAVIEH
jgi:hypothetical protein